MTKEQPENMTETMNVLVAGKTGVGKSTLINSVFGTEMVATGYGKPVTQELMKVSVNGFPINIYDTRGLELNAEAQKISQQAMDELIRELYLTGEKENYLHVIWYCLNAQAKRIEKEEKKLIKSLAKKFPVLLILTQAYGTEAQDFADLLLAMPDLKVKGVLPVVAQDFKLGTLKIASKGLEELVDATYDLLPEAVGQTFINSQKVNLQRKADQAHKIALGYIGTTFGSSFIPIPFADALTLVPIQVAMLTHITKVFNLPIKKAMLTSLAATIIGTSLTTQFGRYLSANLFKLIPGVGSLGGGAISGGVAALLTQLLATSYIQVLKVVAEGQARGQTFSSKEIMALTKKEYKKSFKKNKKQNRKNR